MISSSPSSTTTTLLLRENKTRVLAVSRQATEGRVPLKRKWTSKLLKVARGC
jgi:hypothetical protein